MLHLSVQYISLLSYNSDIYEAVNWFVKHRHTLRLNQQRTILFIPLPTSITESTKRLK